MSKTVISQEQIMKVLEKCYDSAMNGLPGCPSCEELACNYLDKYPDKQIAACKMIKNQEAKCATSGFVTGLGGLLTLPVAIPANVASVLYVQMRMIGALAVMGGYNLHDDEVQTLVYLCLVKSSVTDICKSVGIEITTKASLSLLKKIPGKILIEINKKVGFRLLTKFGTKGSINFVKVVPVLGGVVGGTVDLLGTKSVAKKAYNVFILNNID